MESTRLIFADSRNRDVTLYPDGNSYTLHLSTPVKNVKRVDLVSARVPNTMYNLNTNSNVITTNTSNIAINPGFYSTYGLANAVTLAGTSSYLTLNYLQNEGHFIFFFPDAFYIEDKYTRDVEFIRYSLWNNLQSQASSLPLTLSLVQTFSGQILS
jgi:hypothetical protein